MTDDQHYYAIIVGGRYAGLSAAMALGRSMRRVPIIDSELPCSRQTPHSHNFIAQDGVSPRRPMPPRQWQQLFAFALPENETEGAWLRTCSVSVQGQAGRSTKLQTR